MLLKAIENSILNDFTYYTITIFADSNKPGKTYPKAYKTERNAIKTAENLFNTGNYDIVMLRRQEIIKQVPGITDFSISSPIKEYKQEAQQ